jgi:nucleotide-binding universal stress UspA family protein
MVTVLARSRLEGRRRTRVRRKPRVLDGYRRILVPVADNPESEEAIDVAARLAAEHGSSITAIAVVEVPSLLPADAHMREEEEQAHALLHRAAAIAEKYGVGVSAETVRGRDVASAIVAELFARKIEVVVIGAPRRPSSRASVSIFGRTVEHVLKKAPCRVMIVGMALRHRPAA